MATALSPEVKKFAEAVQQIYTQELKHAFDTPESSRLAHEEELKKRFGRLQAALRAKVAIQEYAVHAGVALVATYLVGDDLGDVNPTLNMLPGFESEDEGPPKRSGGRPVVSAGDPNDPDSMAGW